MAVIEGTSLGSAALAATGAPLKISVSGCGPEPFQLTVPLGADCSADQAADVGAPSCHTHTRVLARGSFGFGRDCTLKLSFGDSVSNGLPWSYKAPTVTAMEASDGSEHPSTDGKSEIVVRGKNMGKTGLQADQSTMPVRVLIGTEFDIQGRYVGDTGMKECGYPTIVTPASEDPKTGVKTPAVTSWAAGFTPARWHAAYNYSSVARTRNVDGHPYLTCMPQLDVNGPKNVTVVIGNQTDSCLTNLRLCADPISETDRRMRRPTQQCFDAEGKPLTGAQADTECRDTSLCANYNDCFPTSIFTSQCSTDTSDGTVKYGGSGEYCSEVSTEVAVSSGPSNEGFASTEGQYRLKIDLNCTLDPAYNGQRCAKLADSSKCLTPACIDWIRPDGIKRALGLDSDKDAVVKANTTMGCDKMKFGPIVELVEPGVFYPDGPGLDFRRPDVPPYVEGHHHSHGWVYPIGPTGYCEETVGCQPKEACKDNNVCSDQGYEYTLKKCQYKMREIGVVNCTVDDECRTMDRNGKPFGLTDGMNQQEMTNFLSSQAPPNQPQAQSRCVLCKPGEPGWPSCLQTKEKGQGTCECFTSPRCALCSVGFYPDDSGPGEKNEAYRQKGYYRVNNRCKECDDQPWVLIVGFFLGIVGICIGGWFLNRYQFNVAFISIGIDYLQVLSLFARSEIQWPAFMLQLFEIFSAFNFNLDIIQLECVIPDLDYRWKWYGTMLMPIGAFILLVLLFLVTTCWRKIANRGHQKFQHETEDSWNNMIALFTLAFYYIYLAVTRRALDIFNCNPSEPFDGYYYTEFVSAGCEGGLCKCYIDGSVQQFLTPFAAAALVFYTAGFPLFICYIVYKYKYIIAEDQIMRA
eukprot:g4632.t1